MLYGILATLIYVSSFELPFFPPDTRRNIRIPYASTFSSSPFSSPSPSPSFSLLLLLLRHLLLFLSATLASLSIPRIRAEDEILWTRAKSVSSRDRSDCRFERAIKLGLLLESELLGRSVPQGALDGTVGVDRRKCKPTCFVIIDATCVRFDRIYPLSRDNYVKKREKKERESR